MNLQNKVAWITGGARMGLAVAEALTAEGCRIAFSYRASRRAAEEACQAIRARGGQALVIRCDLTQKKQVDRALHSILRQYRRLDILVNLSSLYQGSPLVQKRSSIDWENHWKVNASSAYAASIAAAKEMRHGGRIIHISDWTSASGRPRYKDYAAYYVSKSAVKAMVEALALELAPKILVNAIAPGPILPPPGMSRQEKEAVEKATPLGRWGGPAEIAKAVLFLAQSDFVTGETIRVDGGRHLY
jgi:NAD(P)-dependent dehydrogenase (short-subunit alcohol dehydrogenase family)